MTKLNSCKFTLSLNHCDLITTLIIQSKIQSKIAKMFLLLRLSYNQLSRMPLYMVWLQKKVYESLRSFLEATLRIWFVKLMIQESDEKHQKLLIKHITSTINCWTRGRKEWNSVNKDL